jgi:hypothetical protein
VATFGDVRRLALDLPGTSETSSRGQCAWNVNKKGFVWERPLRRSDLAALGDAAPSGPILGVRTADLEMKEVLLASRPDLYFTTPHFNGYAAVLLRLDAISVKELKEIVVEAWIACAGVRAVNEFLATRKTHSKKSSRR